LFVYDIFIIEAISGTWKRDVAEISSVYIACVPGVNFVFSVIKIGN
jgi:hypothetical protein